MAHELEIYRLLGPDGKSLLIPKELYIAFSDFIRTRKYPGSITVQFREGAITCVEAMSRKTYNKQ